jgi:hypothetical protein
MTKTNTRNFDLLYTDLSQIDKDKKNIQNITNQFISKWQNIFNTKNKSDNDVSLDNILEALIDYESLFAHPVRSKPSAYRRLQYHIHLDDDTIKAEFNKIQEFERDIHLSLQFFEL